MSAAVNLYYNYFTYFLSLAYFFLFFIYPDFLLILLIFIKQGEGYGFYLFGMGLVCLKTNYILKKMSPHRIQKCQ